MKWLPLILFILVPLITALFTGWWFPQVPFVRKVKVRSRVFDEQIVEIPASLLQLRRLRNHEGIGDKTVVVHHLNKLVADLERRIRNGMLKTTIMSLLVVVFVVVVLSARSQSTTPNQTPPEPPPGLWESIKIVTDQIPVFLAVPVGMFVFVMESIVSFMFLQDEVNKFNDVLDNTDEPGPPRSSRP